jgi:MOSC domain-containing protein YiiM
MLFTKSEVRGEARELLVGRDRAKGLETERVRSLALTFDGVEGDCHSGLLVKSGSDLLKLHRRGTPLRNVRHATLVSVEELAEIARRLGIPALPGDWLGANIVTAGIPDLTLLPPSTRLQFPSGATLVVDLENEPCRQVADVIRKHHPDQGLGFVKAAQHKRGLAAWVEREGKVAVGDAITLWLPPQRIYTPALAAPDPEHESIPAALH